MGVTGLTTYIYNREHVYFDEIRLMDCALIIDGNSLAPYLYNSNLVRTSAFGGDYDKLADITEKFFKRLSHNNIYPIVVFDGAVEKRKVPTIKTRSKDKLMSLQNVTPHNRNSQCFPLMMRKAMREKLMDMGVLTLQSDLEADSEIAALSKIYRVPVLSNDSDFFIFDVQYIPIPSLSYSLGINSEIRCKLFRMEKFLKHLDLDVKRLPLLAVILGNDYIPRSEFQQFLGQIRLDKCNSLVKSQKMIVGVLRWLKSESVESGLQKILSCKRLRGREVLRHKIIKIMRGYTNLSTVLTQYIPDVSKMKSFNLPQPESLDDEMSKLRVDEEFIDESDVDSQQCINPVAQDDEGSSTDAASYDSSENDPERDAVNPCEVEAILKAGQQVPENLPDNVFPEWLMNQSRVGLVSPDVLTLINLKTYFSTPQPECYDMTFSGQPYFKILQFIAGLLLGPTEFQCWHRQHRNKYEMVSLAAITETSFHRPLPSLDNIRILSSHEKKLLLHEIMDVQEGNLNGVPENWKLLLISISYWLKNDPNYELKPYHLHSVIMMIQTLLVIEGKTGFYRNRKTFAKRYGAAVTKISKAREKFKISVLPVFDSISEALDKVSKEDCILFFDGLLQNFQVDNQIQFSKLFSSTIIHSFARLQYCLSLTSMLNTVLCSPYPDIKIHAFYDGTFLFNTAVNFKKRVDVLAFVDSFLSKVPSLLSLYKVIYKTIRGLCPEMMERKSKKKCRKNRTAKKSVSEQPIQQFDSDSEPFYDKNNRFCALFN